MPTVEVNGARLWYDEAGSGPALLLLHGGLGDSGLWEPVVPFLAERFRVIRTDLRFFGRSTGPAAPWSWEDDVIGVLDELGVERAALAGLSLGGRLAIEIALDHPERITALALVAPGLAGHAAAPYTEEQEARYDAAEAEGDFNVMLGVDLEVWAPLGADERIAQLWFATPDANPLPDGVEPRAPSGAPAKERLGELVRPDARRHRLARPAEASARSARSSPGGAERAPRRAQLRPLRHAARAGTTRRHLHRLPRDGLDAPARSRDLTARL